MGPPPGGAPEPLEDPNTFRNIQNWGASFLEEELQGSAEQPLQVESLSNGLLVAIAVCIGGTMSSQSAPGSHVSYINQRVLAQSNVLSLKPA